MAVMVVVPFPWAVASPPALIVATCALLEDQAAWVVMFSVAPQLVVPIAIKWLVCLGDATDCELGMIAIETSVPHAVPPLAAVAVTVAVAPEVPGMLAEIVVVPAPTAVA